MHCLKQRAPNGKFRASKHKEEQKMFAENLKTIRTTKGYTQEELAIKVKVVRQIISKWEKGLSVPDADILSRLADVLEVNATDQSGSRGTDTICCN